MLDAHSVFDTLARFLTARMCFDSDSCQGERAFMAIDVNGEHRIDFAEFLVGMWNYCTFTRDAMARFAFDLFDEDGSGEIDRHEMKTLILMTLGKRKLKDMDTILRKLARPQTTLTLTRV